MNEIYKKNPLLTIGLFFVLINCSYSQNPADSLITQVSEIVVPQGIKLRHQKTLYYEMVVSRDNFPAPSYWYKLVFAKDCNIQFSLFPLYEEDTYDYYCYKLSPNRDICSAIKLNKLESLNEFRSYKDYEDEEVKAKKDSRFMDLKEVKVKAGDALFVEIFSTSGKDCGHIFEFKMDLDFFVIKVINNKCPTQDLYKSDLIIAPKKYQTVETEKEAIEILDRIFCKIKPNDLMITSIKMDGAKATFKPGLDFVTYEKTISKAPTAAKYDSVITPKSVAIKPIQKDTAKITKTEEKTKPVVMEKVIKKDTVKKLQVIKSTADLANLPSPEAESNSSTNGSTRNRLDIDAVMFNMLLNELKERIDNNNAQLKDLNANLKGATSKEEKENIALSIKQLKIETMDMQEEVKEIRIKLKTIQKFIVENKKTNLQSAKQSGG